MASRSAKSFSFAGLVLRVLFSILLVLATYNPTRYSYVSWVFDHERGAVPPVVLAGVSLLIGYVIYIRATLRSIGVAGILLVAAFLAALLWVLVDLGILSLDGGSALQWAMLTIIAIILGIGLSWSHVRRLLSGQADVDDVDS